LADILISILNSTSAWSYKRPPK